MVDDQPLSETRRRSAPTPTDGHNYLQWLIDAASTSLDALYAQEGFTDDKPPTALLYLLLRHALQLGYSRRQHPAARDRRALHRRTGARRARSDDPFLHVRDNTLVSESRYQPLYAVAPAITGSADAAGARVHRAPSSRTLVVRLATCASSSPRWSG